MDHSHRVDLLSKMLDLDSPCVSDKMIAFLRQVRAMYVRVRVCACVVVLVRW